MKNSQCPNCHTFKITNMGMEFAFMAILAFIFSVFFLPLLFFVPVGIVLAFTKSNKYRCRQCKWMGTARELSDAQN
jgi:hypothetical protein